MEENRPQGIWDTVAEKMLVEFAESGCPIFRATFPLSRVNSEAKDTENCRFILLPTTKIGSVLEVTTSCQYGKHGGIWSLSEDNTHSWVRISQGSNKFVMESNNNDTKVPEDQPEEQALQLIVKDFACR